MPELPEVESIRRGLRRARLCAPIESIWRSRFPLRSGEHWKRRMENIGWLERCTPGPVGRRGKFLIWQFARPSAQRFDLGLVIHLGMTGACTVVDGPHPRAPHTHLTLEFGDGREVRFVDSRRFGGLHVDELAKLPGWGPLGRLGPEPLARSFGGHVLERSLGRSERTLRDGLLDQRVVAGVGNIYVSEALFEAGLHPLIRARRLRSTAWERLAAATIQVVRNAIANGGTTLRDYRNAEGEAGRHQEALWVYGRGGERCRRCGAELVAYVHQGRSGVFCPVDQPRQRAGRVA